MCDKMCVTGEGDEYLKLKAPCGEKGDGKGEGEEGAKAKALGAGSGIVLHAIPYTFSWSMLPSVVQGFFTDRPFL